MANNKSRTRNGSKTRGTQTRKDSSSKRVNYDNTRVDKFDKDEEGFKKTRACNDIRWYSKNPELLKASASLPSYYTTGTGLPFNSNLSVPGVLSYNYAYSIGNNFDSLNQGSWNVVNQAANSIYSYVVHANSRNKSYDAPDLMMVILAGAQVFSAVAHGIRAYGVMRCYNEQNNYMPKALVRAMGFDFDNLRDNLNKMWFDLNEVIARCSQIWIPNTMPVIERWFWLNSNVYMDATTPKSQFYLFNPLDFYKYNETKYPTGGCLEHAGWSGTAANTWQTYMNTVNSMINVLLDSQDRGIIFGDILKAYGEDKIYKLHEIPSDYMVMPIYDQEVLTQIENSTTCGLMMGDIFQGSNFKLAMKPKEVNAVPTTANGFWLPSTSILNYHNTQEMTPEMNMIATRLKASQCIWMADPNVSGQYLYWIYNCGTEYGITYTIWYFNSSGVLTKLDLQSCQQSIIGASALRMLMSFEWHPWLYLQATAPATSSNADCLPDDAIGEYDNYTTIDTVTLSRMHINACYSEYGVPQGM